MKWLTGWQRSESKYVYLFLIAIFLARVLSIYAPSALVEDTFAARFIGWFGVLYSILLPLILVRVWEQLDDIDREFGREADAVRTLYEDLSFLRGEGGKIGREIAGLLREYVRHVLKNYSYEAERFSKDKRADTKILKRIRSGFGVRINEENVHENAIRAGDDILIKIRKRFVNLIHPDMMTTKQAEFIIKELFQRLNEIVDIRGDRISLANQRLFETLRLVALIASILFLVPFYIVAFSTQASLLDSLLILGLTLLVIFMYMIIEDFDEPFGGTWKIDDESWYLVRLEIVCEERQRRLEERRTINDLSKSADRVPMVSSHPSRATNRWNEDW